jgi:cytochrome P450
MSFAGFAGLFLNNIERGRHFCVGASLARQEIATAFNLILDRLDDIELARPLPDPPHLSSLNFLTLKEPSYCQKLWIDDGMKKAAYPSA